VGAGIRLPGSLMLGPLARSWPARFPLDSLLKPYDVGLRGTVKEVTGARLRRFRVIAGAGDLGSPDAPRARGNPFRKKRIGVHPMRRYAPAHSQLTTPSHCDSHTRDTTHATTITSSKGDSRDFSTVDRYRAVRIQYLALDSHTTTRSTGAREGQRGGSTLS
jgi:hypothetical protein